MIIVKQNYISRQNDYFIMAIFILDHYKHDNNKIKNFIHIKLFCSQNCVSLFLERDFMKSNIR